MSRFSPGHDRRARRFRAACILSVLGVVATFVGELWPSSATVGMEFPWLLPLLVLGGIVLALTGIVLALAVLRELNRLQLSNPPDT